jgi:hypothetical protein
LILQFFDREPPTLKLRRVKKEAKCAKGRLGLMPAALNRILLGLIRFWSPTGSSILAQGKAASADAALGRAYHHIAG